MRDTFVRQLLAHARTRREIVLVTGDLGFGVLDGFSRELPMQYINAGVAEQNMTGLAAGLALEGKNVFTYSIGNFPTMRCLEQIRNDVLYHEASVNIVAVGGGFSYGQLGMSHHATEDIGVLRPLPGLRILAPCDEAETLAAVDHMVNSPAPTYLRIDKSMVQDGPQTAAVQIGRVRELRRGRDVALIGYGGIVAQLLTAAALLQPLGIECSIYSVMSLKPIDREGLLDVIARHGAVITVEEHVATGGLGSALADLLLDAGILPRRLARLSLPDRFSSIVGGQDYLRRRHGLDAEAIAARARELVER